MSTDVFTVRPDDLVRLVASVMNWRKISHVPVEDDEGRLLGLVTHRHMIRLLAERSPNIDQEKLVVRDIMESDPPTIAPERPIAEALQEMYRLNTDCLPVVVDQRLVGILTLGDLVRLAAKYFGGQSKARAAAAGQDDGATLSAGQSPE